MTTVKVANADRMIIAVTSREQGINASFADGYSGIVPFSDIPEIEDLSELNTVELPNLYEIILTTTQNETVELPSDFVRHYCDQTYRPRMEMIAVEGRQILGARVRELREAAGLTQPRSWNGQSKTCSPVQTTPAWRVTAADLGATTLNQTSR